MSVGLQATPSQTALGLRYAMASVVAYAWFSGRSLVGRNIFAGIRPAIGDEAEDRGRF